MNGRKKTFLSCSLLAAGLASAGCGINQQSNFQMALLPPAPKPLVVPDADDSEPPAPQPSSLPQEVPVFLISAPKAPPRPSAADAVVDRAQPRFEAGRRFYLLKDLPPARREFDAAVDLMLGVSDSTPSDRTDFEHKLDDMVESIHRYDLSGFGASASLDDGKFEKAPLED